MTSFDGLKGLEQLADVATTLREASVLQTTLPRLVPNMRLSFSKLEEDYYPVRESSILPGSPVWLRDSADPPSSWFPENN